MLVIFVDDSACLQSLLLTMRMTMMVIVHDDSDSDNDQSFRLDGWKVWVVEWLVWLMLAGSAYRMTDDHQTTFNPLQYRNVCFREK